MANVYATDYNNAYVQSTPEMRSSLAKVTVKHNQDTAELSAAAIADIIYFFKVPKDSAIIGGELRSDALGASVTLSVGTVAAPTKYLAATASNTANKVTALTIPIDDAGTPLTEETDIVVTIAGAAATGTVKLFLNTISA